ncbi:MAG: hypothetical protein ACR2QL_02425 [Woeseiaceae bacterium]
MNGLRKNLMNILLFILWLGLGLSLTSARAEGYTIDLSFNTHLTASLPEQDVFIERKPGSDAVYRVTIGDTDMDAPLFKAANSVPRNPFDADAVGPHPKGRSFGMTLGEWLRHTGAGTYTCRNGEGRLDTHFSGLVENGVYSMWHVFTAIPATTPFSGFLNLPLGARDGSTSVFVADENGFASFRRHFKPCLQLSDDWITSQLAINYHSDGRTHAGRPGLFGYNAHVPLFLILPPRTGIQF